MRSRFVVYLIIIAILGGLAYFGVRTDPKSFVGSLFAAFVSVAVIVFVEAELRPQISIVQEEEPPVWPNGRKFLRVIVANRALWRPLKLVMDRRPVYQARAWITFLTETNNPVFSPGRVMTGRWSITPEPVRPLSISPSPGGPPAIGFVWDLSATRDAVDIGAGNTEVLDIVMRDPGEDGCRGWHNRMISRPGETPPEDRFDLSKGRYNALVRVDTSGRSTKALFRIVCDVGIEDFRLEPIRGRLPRGL
jgi:hypothetical protein